MQAVIRDEIPSCSTPVSAVMRRPYVNPTEKAETKITEAFYATPGKDLKPAL